MAVPAVSLEGIRVVFNGKTILDKVTLQVEKGEFWGIIGPNGGGKTTLLRTILGILSPQEGRVYIMGHSPKTAVRKGLVGYLPQKMDARIFPLSALEVVMLGECNRSNFFRPFGVRQRRAAMEALEMVGMARKAHESFPCLSGGEQQRVLIAMALVSKPQILLLDEPNTGMDVVAQEGFYQVMKGLKERLGLTILMVTHDVGVISHFVDRIACLNTTLHYAGDPWGALDCHLLEDLYGEPVDVFVHHPRCEGCHVLKGFKE